MIVSPILPVVLARCPLVRFAMIRRKGVHREGASLRSWLRRRLIVHDDSISYCSVSEILDMVPHWICDARRYGLRRRMAPIEKGVSSSSSAAGTGGVESSATQGLVGAYGQAGQFRAGSGTAPWSLARRALYSVSVATVHAGPLGESRAYRISC